MWLMWIEANKSFHAHDTIRVSLDERTSLDPNLQSKFIEWSAGEKEGKFAPLKSY